MGDFRCQNGKLESGRMRSSKDSHEVRMDDCTLAWLSRSVLSPTGRLDLTNAGFVRLWICSLLVSLL